MGLAPCSRLHCAARTCPSMFESLEPPSPQRTPGGEPGSSTLRAGGWANGGEGGIRVASRVRVLPCCSTASKNGRQGRRPLQPSSPQRTPGRKPGASTLREGGGNGGEGGIRVASRHETNGVSWQPRDKRSARWVRIPPVWPAYSLPRCSTASMLGGRGAWRRGWDSNPRTA